MKVPYEKNRRIGVRKALQVTVISLLQLVPLKAGAQSPRSVSDSLFAEGYSLLQAGNAQASVDKFEAGLKTAPRSPLAHFFLGKAYFILEKYEPAKAHLEKSLEIVPTNQYAPDANTLLRKIAEADARLKAAQIAEERARQAELARQEQERQMELLRQELERQAELARAAAEEAKRPWTDPATSIQWTRESADYIDWNAATDYCRNLQLDGHGDCRLPTLGELQGIFNSGMVGTAKVIQSSSWAWSSNTKGKKEAWTFRFTNEGPTTARRGFSMRDLGALGGRRSGE